MPPVLFVLLACGGAAVAPITPPAADTGVACETPEESQETWETIGQPFTLTYCTGCHAAALTGDARRGAPEGVDLDTLADAQSWAARLRTRVIEERDMPPGGGPTAEEYERLAAWLDCGAPGAENPLPTGSWDTELIQGYSVRIELWEEGTTLLVERVLDDVNLDWREGPLRTDIYTLESDAAWYHGYNSYDASGEPGRAIEWEPPLQLFAGDAVQSVSATITEDGASWSEQQTWTRMEGSPAQVDGHLMDADATELMILEDGGEEHGWLLSTERGMVGRWYYTTDGDGMVLQQLSVDIQLPEVGVMPISPEQPWVENGLVLAVTP